MGGQFVNDELYGIREKQTIVNRRITTILHSLPYSGGNRTAFLLLKFYGNGFNPDFHSSVF
jgi:hypothetical protein